MIKNLTKNIGKIISKHSRYPRLSFEPFAFYGMGAPIGLLLALRGVELLGDEFKFETCKKFLNIFHPMDPFAYRIEPFINTDSPKPVQIPHHKGRKRLHLEIADNLGKAAAEVKAGLMRSMKSVMSSVRRAAGWEEDQQQAEQIANELFQVMITKNSQKLRTKKKTGNIRKNSRQKTTLQVKNRQLINQGGTGSIPVSSILFSVN